MCGIVGYLRLRDRAPFDLAGAVARARDRLEHRGPDSAGLYTSPDGRCVLGSRRLAIRDLSDAGNQPMSNEDGSVWAVFNGEIYNADALRESLTRAGHRFRSRCDTEVLVHLYEERGADLVEEIDGEFGLAIYDHARSSLLAARDRVGVKPLYYASSADRFAFASEPKALLALPDVGREPRLDELPSYLAFSCVPGPATLHRDIEKLEPGMRLRLSGDGGLWVERYWSFPESTSRWSDRREAADALERAMRRAVAKRNLADVPVGATLSGGVDSGLVAAEMSRSRAAPLATFAIGYPGDDTVASSDLSHARSLARVLETDHRELWLDRAELVEVFRELPALADDPNGSPSLAALSHLATRARASGVRVLQIGEGGDEVFGGYLEAHSIWRAHESLARFGRLMPPGRLRGLLRTVGDPIERVLERAPPLGVAVSRAVDPLRRYAAGEHPYWGHGIAFSSHYRKRLLGRRAELGDPHERLCSKLARDPDWQERPYLDRLALVDLQLELPERLLMRADRATMRHGVEARVPFLDPEVLEVAFSIPPRLRAASPKSFLRSYARSRLPATIADRRPSGFPAGRAVFLAPEIAAQIRQDLLAPAFLEWTGLQPEPLERLIRSAERRLPYSLGPVWPLYTLALWARHWT